MTRVPLLFFLSTLLAGCGTVHPAPAPSVSNHLVALTLGRPLPPSPGPSAASLLAQGLPIGAPPLHFAVHVLDQTGHPIAFNAGVYDPTGAGETTILLNSANAFSQALLLPEGVYSFESAVKDDATDQILLAYGSPEDNRSNVQDGQGTVRLKVHSVYDPSSSALALGEGESRISTNRRINLMLLAKTAPVAGRLSGVPTGDLGPVTYRLKNETDGRLDSAGSALGINVLALGTPSDAVLDVEARFSAWVRTGTSDTASLQAQTVSFSHAIELTGFRPDVSAPVVTMTVPQSTRAGTPLTVLGTAMDDVQVQSLRLYDNQTLVASLQAEDGVPPVSLDAAGRWVTTLTPIPAGRHQWTTVATDSSGNEASATQVLLAVTPLPDQTLNYADHDGYTATDQFLLPANSELWVHVETAGLTGEQFLAFFPLGVQDHHDFLATAGVDRSQQAPMDDTTALYRAFFRGQTSYEMHFVNGRDTAIELIARSVYNE